MCCVVTERAIELVGVSGRRAPELHEEALGTLRADVHLVGWLLALEAHAGAALSRCSGRVARRSCRASAIPLPSNSAGGVRATSW